MYIHEIRIQNFRHLRDVALGPFGQPPDGSDLVVLAGPNGGGKSSVLELLGLAISNTWSLGFSLRRTMPTSAFEVAIALTPEDRRLVREYLTASQSTYAQNVLEYIERNGTYYRAFNYPDGRYQQDASLYNDVHNLVTQALRNQYGRPTGFFLKSDRHYPAQAYNRDSFFQWEQKKRREHTWSMAFQSSDVQYADMYEFLVQQRYHYLHQLGAYHHTRQQDPASVPPSPPPDPMLPYDQLLQRLFPGYRFADQKEDVPSNLFVLLPSGDIIPFTDLSSGEKEVFFILSFFIRHDVSNAIIVIDEPEMHLHPELARVLIRTMQDVRPGNQLWLATHNAEIVDEAGRDRVTYVARDPITRQAVVTPATEESASAVALRDLFGYSGYIGVAKNMVFLEGEESSADRKMFSTLFPEHGSRVKLVPTQTVENLPRINAAIMAILESALGAMRFYLIRDRDYLPESVADQYSARGAGRLYVLERQQIENYLLDDDLIAKVCADIYNRTAAAPAVGATLHAAAVRIAGEVLRDMVAFRLNLVFRPQDFSLGQAFAGQMLLNPDGTWSDNLIAAFKSTLSARVGSVTEGLSGRTNPQALDTLVAACQSDITRALEAGSDSWRVRFPGKRLLQEYARVEGLGESVVFINSLIKELGASRHRIPAELRTVIDTIAAGGTLTQTMSP